MRFTNPLITKRRSRPQAENLPRAVKKAERAPAGTVDEVRAWVGDNPGRALVALEGETRKTLVEHLERIAGR